MLLLMVDKSTEDCGGPWVNGGICCLCRKRTISEVQFMHNVREHKQVGERQDWLQEKLKDIIVVSAKPQHAQSGNTKSIFSNDVLRSNMWKTWMQVTMLVYYHQARNHRMMLYDCVCCLLFICFHLWVCLLCFIISFKLFKYIFYFFIATCNKIITSNKLNHLQHIGDKLEFHAAICIQFFFFFTKYPVKNYYLYIIFG